MFKIGAFVFLPLGLLMLLFASVDLVQWIAFRAVRIEADAVVIHREETHRNGRVWSCMAKAVYLPPAPPDTVLLFDCLDSGAIVRRTYLPAERLNSLNQQVELRYADDEIQFTDFVQLFIGLIFGLLGSIFWIIRDV